MKRISVLVGVASLFSVSSAHALELDWSGQFRTELHLVHNYAIGGAGAGETVDSSRSNAGGYYIPGGGSDTANFRPLFMRLRPKLVVNDNIYIKSEFWLGDPVFGLFGNATPYTSDQKNFYNTQSRGSLITAQRFWGEFQSDIGTFQVGRAPMNYGLGIVWNSGDGLWDRYMSTGDMIRLVSKFGAFSFSPAYISYAMGNTIAGSCTFSSATSTNCTPTTGGAGMQDYSLMIKYDNLDEDFEGGLNFIKRLAGTDEQNVTGPTGGGTGGMNFNTWDIFGRKRFGRFSIAGEVPITSGHVGALEYSTVALAAEAGYKASESFDLQFKAGHAPGQPNSPSTTPDRFKAFFFHPNYRLGLIMFNYQFRNFAGPQTLNSTNLSQANLQSPYDNPIVNANYFSLGAAYHTDKWTFRGSVIHASATESASANNAFYNDWTRTMQANNGGDQSNNYGWETDLGALFQWDEYFQFKFDFGLFFPGDFYKFSNTATENPISTVWAGVFGVGVSF